jgi:hypothetical protein
LVFYKGRIGGMDKKITMDFWTQKTQKTQKVTKDNKSKWEERVQKCLGGHKLYKSVLNGHKNFTEGIVSFPGTMPHLWYSRVHPRVQLCRIFHS